MSSINQITSNMLRFWYFKKAPQQSGPKGPQVLHAFIKGLKLT